MTALALLIGAIAGAGIVLAAGFLGYRTAQQHNLQEDD